MNRDLYLSILDICHTHAERLRWAMQELEKQKPFTSASLAALTQLELAILDQFIVRFSKLQDAMGAKLLPATLELTYEEGQLATLI